MHSLVILRKVVRSSGATSGLLVFSGADEYVPPGVLESLEAHSQRLVAAIRGAGNRGCRVSAKIIEGASHGLDDPRHAAAFVAMVETVLMALQP
eukprot:m.304966 g.304966  ORF g.304966 m.304966 type:complete len:94 (-) comp20176_c0_seq6:972-1253(-)